MSGMLAQAGSMGPPVIVCKEGLIGWFTEKYELGIVFNDLDEKGVIDAINRLLLDKEKLFKFGNAARKCFAEHTKNNFLTDIFQLIP
jgi:glycosyltransferase involved in cell wall biosynthesis